ncbi:MAG TPA: AAA family ATPase [Gammaproteobacteria bacterium]|nr:AAA family ATPase [Gammaproteobacteria bacterium]
MNDRHDLELVLQSRIPLVALETREERRAMELLRELAVRNGLPLFRWTLTEGLVSVVHGLGLQEETREPAAMLQQIKQQQREGIYVLVDFHPWLGEPLHVRLLKDIAIAYEQHGQTLVLLSHDLDIPPELAHYCATLSLSLPDQAKIAAIVRDTAADWSRSHGGRKVRADREALARLERHLAGLTLAEARRLAKRAIHDDGAITGDDIPRLLQAKYALLNREGVLQYEYETERFAGLGGFARLREWLVQRRRSFYEDDGVLDRPRGILLLGVQGCGKSLAARAVAGEWGLPLLRLDAGALFNKYHGETERNLRETLKAAGAMAPCVLWIDEIEKGFSVSGSDGGTSQRVLGTLLTWMAENRAPVFLVATANDITALPPELVRKGRLDEIFFVDLPDLSARRDIFAIHLRRRRQDPAHFALAELARRCAGFSGAEIEQVVVSALYSARAREQALSDEQLQEAIRQTRPLSVIMAEKIEALREWAEDRTVNAN